MSDASYDFMHHALAEEALGLRELPIAALPVSLYAPLAIEWISQHKRGDMINYRILDRPAFAIIGRKTWISGPDNEQFGRFWIQARAEGLFDAFSRLGAGVGPQTGGVVLGVSRVEQDPANRSFDYMIAVEEPQDSVPSAEGRAAGTHDLERYVVPAARWAVFECRGHVPESIVAAEMYAFMEWLPASGYAHALAPEMEVYLPGSDDSENSVCEFWLPVAKREED